MSFLIKRLPEVTNRCRPAAGIFKEDDAHGLESRLDPILPPACEGTIQGITGCNGVPGVRSSYEAPVSQLLNGLLPARAIFNVTFMGRLVDSVPQSPGHPFQNAPKQRSIGGKPEELFRPCEPVELLIARTGAGKPGEMFENLKGVWIGKPRLQRGRDPRTTRRP